MLQEAKLKVLHVHVMPVVSGSGINTYLSMVGVDTNRYQVDFACAPGGPLNDMAVNAGIRFHPVKNFVQPISPWNDLRTLWQLIRIIRRGQYDIVHTHNSKGGILGRLAAWLCRVPIIIHTIHGFAFHDSETAMRKQLFIFLERWAAKMADKLIVISQPLQDWGLKLAIGKPAQYTKIYSGIEIDKFKVDVDVSALRKKLGIGEHDFVFGLVAKLWDGKGHITAIEALKQLLPRVPNARLVFVGDGYLREVLEQHAKKVAVEERIVFTGFRSDIAELNAMFDVAILVSDFEGMGRVLLEAMVMGRPAVASNVGGIPDVVDDGQTGILIPPGDSPALAAALERLYLDSNLRQSMGVAGKKKITEQFSAATMVRKIVDVYEEQIRLKLPQVALSGDSK
jgi:glycosyltransferase involved in cell wall biosynthesis